MKLRALSLSLLVFIAVSTLVGQTPAPDKPKFSPPSRKFRFTYSFTVKDIPSGTKLVRVWVPVAHTDEHQTVRLLNVKAPVQTRMAEESEYGNHILYAEIHNPAQATAEFTLEYEVTRREYARGDYAQLEPKDTKPGVVLASMQRYVEPDKLVPTSGEIKSLADKVTAGQTGTVAKSKAAYDYLFATMRYDKTGTGWGRGDAVWACDSKHGNCTDFHSVFIGMMRSDDIPARFDIGFPLPEEQGPGRHPRISLLGGVLRPQHRLDPGRYLRGVEGQGESRLFLRQRRHQSSAVFYRPRHYAVAQAGWSAAELLCLSLRRGRWQNLRRDQQEVQLRRGQRAKYRRFPSRSVTSHVGLATTQQGSFPDAGDRAAPLGQISLPAHRHPPPPIQFSKY